MGHADLGVVMDTERPEAGAPQVDDQIPPAVNLGVGAMARLPRALTLLSQRQAPLLEVDAVLHCARGVLPPQRANHPHTTLSCPYRFATACRVTSRPSTTLIWSAICAHDNPTDRAWWTASARS